MVRCLPRNLLVLLQYIITVYSISISDLTAVDGYDFTIDFRVMRPLCNYSAALYLPSCILLFSHLSSSSILSSRFKTRIINKEAQHRMNLDIVGSFSSPIRKFFFKCCLPFFLSMVLGFACKRCRYIELCH